MPSMLSLVLSGGGARAAYEAGVLRFLYRSLGPRLDGGFHPRIVSGTSAGALSGAFVAAAEDRGSERLSRFMREMRPEHVYEMGLGDLLSLPAKLLGHHAAADLSAALFDPTPLYARIRDELPWRRLHDRLDRGELHAFVVTTTDIADGRCVLWADGKGCDRLTPTFRMVPRRVAAEHVLASAAIPFVFPPVAVEGRYHVDGGLRLNTPLVPAITLGASRVLIVSVSPTPDEVRPVRLRPDGAPEAPTPLSLAGKALDALTTDPIQEDLRRCQHINELLAWAEAAYPGFNERQRLAGRGYRHVETLHLHPSVPLGVLAASAYERCADDLPFATRRVLDVVAAAEGPDDGDLVSYLLFHHRFTAEAEELGFEDARRQEAEIVELLTRKLPPGSEWGEG